MRLKLLPKTYYFLDNLASHLIAQIFVYDLVIL
jgi:hypothetical protein